MQVTLLHALRVLLPTVAVCFAVGLAITAFFSISADALTLCPAMITVREKMTQRLRHVHIHMDGKVDTPTDPAHES